MPQKERINGLFVKILKGEKMLQSNKEKCSVCGRDLDQADALGLNIHTRKVVCLIHANDVPKGDKNETKQTN